MMKIKLLFLIFTMFLLISFVSAVSIDVEIGVQEFFSVGEELSFNYTLISEVNTPIVFISHILCSNAPIGFSEEKIIDLQANIPHSNIYQDQIVQDWFEPQVCVASIRITSPIEKVFSKSFSIETAPSFDFNLLFCKDQSCIEKTKVFIQGEDVYLDYESSVENPSVTAILTYPDELTEQILLPYSFTAEQVGNYELEVTATKEGYKTITKREIFGIIEGNAQIENISGEGDLGEDNFTEEFEGDFNGGGIEKKKELNNIFYWFAGFIILILLFLIIGYFVRKKFN